MVGAMLLALKVAIAMVEWSVMNIQPYKGFGDMQHNDVYHQNLSFKLF